jgi:hypothetical protein
MNNFEKWRNGTMSKEWGLGQLVAFNHGWPLNADAWEDQIMYLGRPACLSQILIEVPRKSKT